MARSASIDCLAFHNFSMGLDSIVIKYDDSKADKAGEKLSEKNVYANPLDWTMCTWTALGEFFSLLYTKQHLLTLFFSSSSPTPRCILFSLPGTPGRE